MSSRFTSNIQRSTRRNFRRTAFTMVELLVVIAIVAILAATLLPALARSQPKTRLTQCLNNLHQFGLAINMYGNDNQNYLPYPNWAASSGLGSSAPGWLYTPLAGTPPPIAFNPILTYRKGLLWQYIQNINQYWCPVDAATTNQPYSIGGGSTYSQRVNRVSTYTMNGAACGFNGQYPAYKTSQIRSSAVILWEPNDRNSNGSYDVRAYNDGAAYPSDGIGLLHNLVCNLLYLDGHVVPMLRTNALALISSSTTNEFWWNPSSGSVNSH